MSSIQNKRANLQPAKHLYCNSGLICRVFPEYARTVRTRLVYEISSGFEPNRFGSRIEEIRLISEIHEEIQMAQPPLFREVRTLIHTVTYKYTRSLAAGTRRYKQGCVYHSMHARRPSLIALYICIPATELARSRGACTRQAPTHRWRLRVCGRLTLPRSQM